jgi:hypothetical protein
MRSFLVVAFCLVFCLSASAQAPPTPQKATPQAMAAPQCASFQACDSAQACGTYQRSTFRLGLFGACRSSTVTRTGIFSGGLCSRLHSRFSAGYSGCQ